MKELNDKDFDQIFKNRIAEELPTFEEESWLKMEKKLRKRDRMIFLRYAAVLLIFLSFGTVFYMLNNNTTNPKNLTTSKNGQETPIDKTNPSLVKTLPEKLTVNNTTNKKVNQSPNLIHLNFKKKTTVNHYAKINKTDVSDFIITNQPNNVTKNEQAVLTFPEQSIATNNNTVSATNTEPIASTPDAETSTKRKIPFSLAIVAGPDFSSTSALIGGKTGVNIGINVGIGITKKLSLQTGIIYGSKNYVSSAYDYTFGNPNVNKASFSQINAACEVLEIPLKASYNISENQKRSIELSAGLSSYIMVKENYVFKYNAALNRADRVTDLSNANQHYLSVVDLSATYNLKLKNKKFAFGIEPYLKIPLTGVGDGNVPLKSSGVSLKLRYDFNKK